jgi:hypothetical protein
VPFYIRMGKRLPKKSTEISIHFKEAPKVLFNTPCGATDPGGNVLVIRIQPDEGISLRMARKSRATTLRLEPVKMDFHYADQLRPQPARRPTSGCCSTPWPATRPCSPAATRSRRRGSSSTTSSTPGTTGAQTPCFFTADLSHQRDLRTPRRRMKKR